MGELFDFLSTDTLVLESRLGFAIVGGGVAEGSTRLPNSVHEFISISKTAAFGSPEGRLGIEPN